MSHSRRKFIKSSATLAALAGTGSLGELGALGSQEAPKSKGSPESKGQPDPVGLPAEPGSQERQASTNGIQIGADSFVDEGTEKVLDILQEKGAVNTLYLSTFTYDRGITGRPGPGKNYPGHGIEASDKNYFHGGNYATPHAQYYTNTAIKGEKLKAPDLGS
ncbi:MAG TPA: twin-arginine translocation signal domain-containing protein, partial [Puia sp.]|nr:twin-arginine translocation signal domain-containing protein [Puia sp.]